VVRSRFARGKQANGDDGKCLRDDDGNIEKRESKIWRHDMRKGPAKFYRSPQTAPPPNLPIVLAHSSWQHALRQPALETVAARKTSA
jgi:hypothetical protein